MLLKQGDLKSKPSVPLPIPIPVVVPALPIQLPVLPTVPKVEKPTPIVLPVIAGLPGPFKNPSSESLQKAFEAVYSDENSEKSDSESELGTLDTIEEPTTRTG